MKWLVIGEKEIERRIGEKNYLGFPSPICFQLRFKEVEYSSGYFLIFWEKERLICFPARNS